jgi:hypothetical protein
MPQFGRLAGTAIATINEEAPAPAPPWKVPAALAQMVTFEVDAEATLDLLPEMLSRPAPPYARILVAEYPESPVGPYCEALLLLSCRYLMLPRQLVVASVVTSEAARAANARNWHYTSEVGEVRVVREGASFESHISVPSGPVIHVLSLNAQETGIASIRYDPIVVVQLGAGPPEVLTISSDPIAVHDAWLAPGSTATCEGGASESAWWKLRSRNPITGTIARQDMERPEPSIVEPPAAGAGGGLP